MLTWTYTRQDNDGGEWWKVIDRRDRSNVALDVFVATIYRYPGSKTRVYLADGSHRDVASPVAAFRLLESLHEGLPIMPGLSDSDLRRIAGAGPADPLEGIASMRAELVARRQELVDRLSPSEPAGAA